MSSSLRRRVGLVAMVVVAAVGPVAVSTPALATPAGKDDSESRDRTYLALGDSVPFGLIGNAVELYPDPDNFVGYPDLIADDWDLRLINASCPGETTASFIDADAQSNGCANSLDPSGLGYRDRFPLHEDYEGAQLDYALEVLDDSPRVRLVTIQLGANDLFLCLGTGQCTTPAEAEVMADQLEENLDVILDTLRDEGDYRGRIVVLTYYALDYTNVVEVDGFVRPLNEAIAEAADDNDAVVADAFEAFESRALEAGGSTIAAGLLYPDDVHPTAEGHRLLARAVERAVGH
ncbi:GDSL-type esterase/lipase family protein [Blastococcus sp. CT_GayMR19]|uniref:SGNH/GDSL hydrolase family protein n=1 Tax=Blastococcus sp. CT_GayMR19 TaxID=2559608 RepID=UPI00142F9608|nr:GDSL-type esterase/lipase family protein [Blastococcus sp. CT_GayMR19]